MENEIPDHLQKPPKNSFKKLHLAFLVIQVLILVIAFLSLMGNGAYGWTLFCIIPFSIGLTIGTYTNTFRSKSLLRGSGWTILVIFILSMVMLGGGMEGAICIIMALGIILVPAVIGVAIGYSLRSSLKIYSLIIIFVLCSSSMVYDEKGDEQVHSTAAASIVIKAPRSKIWEVLTHRVRFSESNNLFFRAGISYPTSMHLTKKDGDCLFLDCTFNNGHEQLKIQHLDSLKTMVFSINENITAMKELSFYKEISAPHLKGYFKPTVGGFTIFEKGPNECVLVATTAYSYKISPAFYWHWWTDYLGNTMHMQVLKDLKALSEKP